MSMRSWELDGSDRPANPEAVEEGPLEAGETLVADFHVRPREPIAWRPGSAPVPRELLSTRHRADPNAVEAVGAFVSSFGLEVVAVDEAKRTVTVSGPSERWSQALGVRPVWLSSGSSRWRSYSGRISLPEALSGMVSAVLGLDESPVAKPSFRIADPASAKPLDPPQVAAAYDFPKSLDGTGTNVGILEFGGGYNSSDLAAYFGRLGIPVPTVVAVGVGGAANSPGSGSSGPDGEVALDIEVAGALAPKATFVVYFAPNTEKGFVDAVKAALHDTARPVDVVSISWGGPEPSWSGQGVRALDGAIAEAAAAGVPVCVAAGDNGSSDGVNDGLAHVDFPASSPHALGCGGTRLELAGGSPVSETVWNSGPGGGATGGGVSALFPVPQWQQSAGVLPAANPGARSGRGVPDVAGDADPATGYPIVVDGQSIVVGGTSAVAPLWAALVALFTQSKGGPVGFLNSALYESPVSSSGFTDITVGSNGAYSAGPGWDACSGWGSPLGQRLLGVLRAAGF